MPILGVGTDIIFLPRIASLVKRRTAQRLASRILCEQEHKLWLSLPASNDARSLRFLAVRWSIKEAAYKALQPSLRLTWKQLSFLDDPASSSSRKPILRMNSDAASSRLKVQLHASVSHDGDNVVAMVVAETYAPS